MTSKVALSFSLSLLQSKPNENQKLSEREGERKRAEQSSTSARRATVTGEKYKELQCFQPSEPTDLLGRFYRILWLSSAEQVGCFRMNALALEDDAFDPGN